MIESTDLDWYHQLEADLVRDEGEVLHAYSDAPRDDASALASLRGFLTIGVGILIDSRRGGGISRAASRFMLREKIEQISSELDNLVPWWRELTGARQSVLLNVAYNVGVSGLMGFKNMLHALEHGYYDSAAEDLLNSRAARQTSGHAAVLDSPETRYGRLAQMLREE